MAVPKIAIVISHPIQHFCPQFASYAKSGEWNVKVFFASAMGYKTYKDNRFGVEINWNNLYLDKFAYEFLNEGKVLRSDYLLDAPELGSKLDEFNPDAVIVYGYIQKFQRRAISWTHKNKKKLLFIADSELRHKRNLFKSFLKRWILPFYLKKPQAFLTVGDANEQYYRYFGVKDYKFYRTFFPIDIELYKESVKQKEAFKKEVYKKYNISPNAFLCCNVGKLVDFKAQTQLVDLLFKLKNYTDKEIVIFIIGSGPDFEDIKLKSSELSNHRIILTGFVKPEELPEYYGACEVYIHPSGKDPHSLAISEAIYMGCVPIISSLCGSYGPTDDVRPGFNGFVYEYAKIDQLAYYILILINNPDLLKEFSENSMNIAKWHQELAHGKGLRAALNNIFNNNIEF